MVRGHEAAGNTPLAARRRARLHFPGPKGCERKLMKMWCATGLMVAGSTSSRFIEIWWKRGHCMIPQRKVRC